MVGDATDDVGVTGDLGQVNRAAQHAHSAGSDQRVAQPHQHHVTMQRSGHPGGVGIPEQHVERCRLAALHVVVHHVAPHQVGGPQPREHLRHITPVHVALAARNSNGRLRRAVAHRRGRETGPGLVQHGDRQV